MKSDNIIVAMQRLLEWFAPRCSDRRSMDELMGLLSAERARWQRAHKLLQAQYSFEEVCAKTIYNLSRHPAPFDADSPYWIIPNAAALARKLQIDETEILRIIAPEA
jgi:hypothetical protein